MSKIPEKLAYFLCGGKPCPHHEKVAREVYDEILLIQQREREEEAKKALDRLAGGKS